MPERPIRVLLVDAGLVVREALARLLEAEGLAVCAQVGTRADALAQAGVQQPDVALVEPACGGGEELLLIADLRAQGIPVVACSMYEGPPYVPRALRAGAQAYVAKREAGDVVAHVIRAVLAGWMLVSPQAARGLPEGA